MLVDTILYTRTTTFWGAKMNIKWTEGEKEFIRQNANALKDRELAEKLTAMSSRNITLDAVRKVRQKLGITKLPGRGVCGLVCQDKQEGAIDGAVYTIPDRTDRVSG